MTGIGHVMPSIQNPPSCAPMPPRRPVARRPAAFPRESCFRRLPAGLRAGQAAARNGAGVLIASSDHEELAHVCDRVLVLHAGRLVVDVSTQDIDARGIVALTYQAVNNA